MSLRVQDPLWLLLLVVLGVVGVLAIRRQRRVAVLFSDVNILRTLGATAALRIKRALPWVRLLGPALVIAALARPQCGLEEFRIRTEGIAIQMCIDRSGSMAALDFNLDGQQVDRLTVVKRVFHDFVMGKGKLPGRPDDLIGLISFGGFVEPKCPLTLDHGALVQVLHQVEIPHPIFDGEGREINQRLWREDSQTAIGDALALAEDAAKQAAERGVKVFTVGLGDCREGARIPLRDASAQLTYLQYQGQERWSKLNDQLLKQIALTTGGAYIPAGTQAYDLGQVYADHLARLTRGEYQAEKRKRYQEQFQLFVCLGVALLLLEMGVANYREVPK